MGSENQFFFHWLQYIIYILPSLISIFKGFFLRANT